MKAMRARVPFAWPGGLATLVMGLLLPCCQVTRMPPRATTDAGDESLLKRANAALLDRIREEQAHVESNNRRLDVAKAKEILLTNQLAVAEADYKMLDEDLGELEVDLDDIRQETQAQLDRKTQLERRLETIRGEAHALEQQRAAQQSAVDASRAAVASGAAAATNAKQRLAKVTSRETVMAREVEIREALVLQRTARLSALQDELFQLERTIQQKEGTRQWLRASLLAALFTASLRREGMGWPDARVDAAISREPVPGPLGAVTPPTDGAGQEAPWGGADADDGN